MSSAVKATAKGIRISPRKMGLVAALVRGRSVADSLVILEHTPKRGAPVLAKVVESATANAVNNHKATKDTLEVASVLVSPGSIIKRYRPGARGMVRPIRHRTSHVTVIVDATKQVPEKKAPIKQPKAKKAANGSKS